MKFFDTVTAIILVYLVGAVSGSKAAELPEAPAFSTSPLTVEIPTNIRAFQGEIPNTGGSVTYHISGQYFPSSEKGKIKLADEKIDVKKVIPLLINPYLTISLGSTLDKIGDTPGRLLLSKPACMPQLSAIMDVKFTNFTKEMFNEAESVNVILAIQKNDKVVVFYEIPNEKSGKERILVRSLEKIGPVYLFDCAPIDDAVLLNIMTVLTTQGRDRLLVRPGE